MRPWFGVLREGKEVVILGGRSAKAVRPLFCALACIGQEFGGGKKRYPCPKGQASLKD